MYKRSTIDRGVTHRTGTAGRFSGGVSVGLTAGLAAGLCLPAVADDEQEPAGPVATVILQIDDADPIVMQQPGALLESGSVSYQGAIEDEDGKWDISWNYSADLNPDDDATINGDFVLHNLSSETHEYNFRLLLPLCPQIANGSVIGALTAVSLELDEDGGTMSCEPGEAIWSALIDGDIAWSLFPGTFTLGGTGAGSMSTNTSFGTPMPNYPAPAVEQTIGVEIGFDLTGGEEVEITSLFKVGGQSANFVECPPDPPDGEDNDQVHTPTGFNGIRLSTNNDRSSSSSERRHRGSDSKSRGRSESSRRSSKSKGKRIWTGPSFSKKTRAKSGKQSKKPSRTSSRKSKRSKK